MSKFRQCAVAALSLAALNGAAAAAAAAETTGVEQLTAVQAAAEGEIHALLRDVTYATHVQAGQLDPRLRLAPCPAPLGAALPARAELGARVAVRVSCTAPGSAWVVYVPVNIESDISVLVLRRSVLRGARLASGEVVAETRRVPGLAIGYVTDVASLEHRTLARPLAAGTALTADALLADLIVHQARKSLSLPPLRGSACAPPARPSRTGARARGCGSRISPPSGSSRAWSMRAE